MSISKGCSGRGCSALPRTVCRPTSSAPRWWTAPANTASFIREVVSCFASHVDTAGYEPSRFCPVLRPNRAAAAEQGGNNLKRLKSFHVRARTRRWSYLFCMRQALPHTVCRPMSSAPRLWTAPAHTATFIELQLPDPRTAHPHTAGHEGIFLWDQSRALNLGLLRQVMSVLGFQV